MNASTCDSPRINGDAAPARTYVCEEIVYSADPQSCPRCGAAPLHSTYRLAAAGGGPEIVCCFHCIGSFRVELDVAGDAPTAIEFPARYRGEANLINLRYAGAVILQGNGVDFTQRAPAEDLDLQQDVAALEHLGLDDYQMPSDQWDATPDGLAPGSDLFVSYDEY